MVSALQVSLENKMNHKASTTTMIGLLFGKTRQLQMEKYIIDTQYASDYKHTGFRTRTSEGQASCPRRADQNISR